MHTPVHLSIQKNGGKNTTQTEVVNRVYRWCFRGGVVRMSLCDVIGSFKEVSVRKRDHETRLKKVQSHYKEWLDYRERF